MTEEWNKLRDELQKDYPDLSEEELKEKLKTDAELMLRASKRMKRSEKEIGDWLSIMGG